MVGPAGGAARAAAVQQHLPTPASLQMDTASFAPSLRSRHAPRNVLGLSA
jgi:hypothetical protein